MGKDEKGAVLERTENRVAACGGHARADLRDASCGPPPLPGCGPLRPFGRKFRIQNSRFKITNRAAACGGRNDAKELRASAAGRLRPANRCAIASLQKSPQPSGRACDHKEQPSAGEGRLRAAAPVPGANSKFKIQNSELMGSSSSSGCKPAEDATTQRSCGPPPGGGCGPPIAARLLPCKKKPAAERTGLRRRGAALRPGAAAGCRSLRDRARRKTP